MEPSFIIEKVIQQVLSEQIGFDAAKIYWDLIKNKNCISFSHNKKYRILQDLYKNGLLFKIKKEGSFNYIPIPPSAVIFDEKIDKEIVLSLDKDYMKSYFDFFKSEILLETNGKNLDGLILFFVRNLIKEKAMIVSGGSPVYDLLKKKLPEHFNQIKFIGIENYFKDKHKFENNLKLKKEELISEKRFVLIDNKYLLVFFKIFENSYFGYFSQDKKKIEEKEKEFNFLWNF